MAQYKWYLASSLTGDDNSLDVIPNPGAYTDLVTGDKCFVEINGRLSLYKYDSTEAGAANGSQLVIPDDNSSGTGAWLLIGIMPAGQNGFEESPADVTLSFVNGTRTFSVAPTGASSNYFINGGSYSFTTQQDVIITDVHGLHWIYFDDDGTLTAQAPGGSTDALILTKCLVGSVYWDATNNLGLEMDETHGSSMAPATHYHFHEGVGALYESGLGLSAFDVDGSGANATAAQFDVGNGEYHDEDIEIIITGGSPQQLINATIPTFYKIGASGNWFWDDATTNFPVADGSIDLRLDWNDINGGTWQRLEVTNNDFVLTHYYATNMADYPIAGVMGQAEYGTAGQARAGAEVEAAAIDLAGLPGPEWILIASVIWQTSDSYSNQVQARIRSTDEGDDYVDWRQTPISGVSQTNLPTLQLNLLERSSDPDQPAEGEAVIWMSDGTGKGDDGDILMASTAGGTTNYSIIFDHSAGSAW